MSGRLPRQSYILLQYCTPDSTSASETKHEVYMQQMDSPSRSLDEALQALRDACPLLKTSIYLANCSQGPLSEPVRAALDGFMEDWAAMGMHWDAWVEEVERARATFAALIGAQPEEVAVGTSVSQLVSSLASALVNAPSPSAHRIVSSAAEFP